MDIRPKIVIVARAVPISSSLAFIAGAVAAIAEAPQIHVPTAIRVESSSDNLNFFPNFMAIKKIKITIITTIGKTKPTWSHIKGEIINPYITIAILSKIVEEKLIPLSIDLGIEIMLVIIMLKIKDHIKVLIEG